MHLKDEVMHLKDKVMHLKDKDVHLTEDALIEYLYGESSDDAIIERHIIEKQHIEKQLIEKQHIEKQFIEKHHPRLREAAIRLAEFAADLEKGQKRELKVIVPSVPAGTPNPPQQKSAVLE